MRSIISENANGVINESYSGCAGENDKESLLNAPDKQEDVTKLSPNVHSHMAERRW